VDGPVRLRPVQWDDLALLARWLRDPAVSAYYTESAEPDRLAAKLGPRIRGESRVRAHILVAEGRDIGYGQHYRLTEGERAALALASHAAWGGFDLFVAAATDRGRGLGLAGVQALLAALEGEGADRVAVDTWVDNRAAIRCYERAGLSIRRRLPRREVWQGVWRDHWLMTGDVLRRPLGP
jgi:aminoglycoside 6'-N-acetyltransferase